MGLRAKIVGGLVGLGALILVGAAASNPSTKTADSAPPPAQTAVEHQPVVETKDVPVTTDINFETVRQNDSTLEQGKEVTTQQGAKGTKETIYTVNLTDGVETNRVEKSSSITKAPINKIVHIGTKTYAVIPAPTTPAPKASTPSVAPAPQAGPSAICKDGTPSYSQNRSGTCSHHGGVAQWL